MFIEYMNNDVRREIKARVRSRPSHSVYSGGEGRLSDDCEFEPKTCGIKTVDDFDVRKEFD